MRIIYILLCCIPRQRREAHLMTDNVGVRLGQHLLVVAGRLAPRVRTDADTPGPAMELLEVGVGVQVRLVPQPPLQLGRAASCLVELRTSSFGGEPLPLLLLLPGRRWRPWAWCSNVLNASTRDSLREAARRAGRRLASAWLRRRQLPRRERTCLRLPPWSWRHRRMPSGTSMRAHNVGMQK